MNGRFQIFLRHRQHTFEGANVIVQCNPTTGYAEYVPGTIDNQWYDYTNFIEGSENLSLIWDSVNNGNSGSATTNQDGSNYDKGVSSDLTFFDEAYQFIWDWLLASDCQILNSIEVKIVDLIGGGAYRIFEIKNDNIEYAEEEPCRLVIKIREQDGVWHCVHKNVIWDNWQHWFEESLVKAHPCFLTCIEPRPRILASVRLGLLMFWHSAPPLVFSTGNTRVAARRILGADRFVDSPLVRTYITNIAMKCGLQTDTIFDTGQEFENVCVFYPSAGFMHQDDGDDVLVTDAFFHIDNRWLITLSDFLDKLKIVFAAEWYVTPNSTIVFKHTKDLITLAAIYDFTANGAMVAYDVRYSFDGEKKPAYGRYQYTNDGSDLASQEASTLYNDIVDYDGPVNNPMLEGEKIKQFEFAPTGFVRDGRSKDYLKELIEDGFLVGTILLVILAVVGAFIPLVGAGVIIAAGIWEGLLIGKRNMLNNTFVDEHETYTGAVRITAEQVITPRLLLWNGEHIKRAKVVYTTFPAPNTYYNSAGLQYPTQNKINVDNSNPALRIYNYPLYFDSEFTGNLYDKHDPIDNPLKSKESHQNVKFYVDLCPEALQLFGVFENSYAVIGKVVKLRERDNYGVYVRIKNINVNHAEDRIYIRGKVLRRSI